VSEEKPLDNQTGGEPVEIVQLMSRSVEFTKELMAENERLRFRVVELSEENRKVNLSDSLEDKQRYLQQQIRQLEGEKARLLEQYQLVEEQNQVVATRYVEIEEENNNLANLYVCSYQLHSTLDFDEVTRIIMEIIINLIGAEEFGIFLLEEKTQILRPVAMEGISLEGVPAIPLGEGIIGQAAVSGENYYSPGLEEGATASSLSHPLVCIPLKIKDQVIGVIVLYKLLPQKTQFANVDYELFTLLAGHAATAIFSSRLYSEAERKLHTIKGFMELLTKPQ
jgi:transcriptional regulator with GAF, ATPase, and Fis domain